MSAPLLISLGLKLDCNHTQELLLKWNLKCKFLISYLSDAVTKHTYVVIIFLTVGFISRGKLNLN